MMELEQQETYRLLDLSYIREISKGDLGYERNVANLFLTIVPENLASLEKDMLRGDYAHAKSTLHHMQSSISIMGFYPQLEAYMEPTVYSNIPPRQFQKNVQMILDICKEALVEADRFLRSLK